MDKNSTNGYNIKRVPTSLDKNLKMDTILFANIKRVPKSD